MKNTAMHVEPDRTLAAQLNFCHRPETEAFWRRLARRGLGLTTTPFYLCAAAPLAEALAELDDQIGGLGVPIQHWLSCKTQPVRPLLRWWRKQGRPIEVVSEFELLAALKEGFRADRILVNGPAKRHWLARHALDGLSVNFDSLAEARALAALAKRHHWRVGLRCLTLEERLPEPPYYPTQFGLASAEMVAAIKYLQKQKARLEVVHFHLRTNVPSAGCYLRAIAEVAEICRSAGFSPAYLDCGGGFPPRHTFPLPPAPSSRPLAVTGQAPPLTAYAGHFDFEELRDAFRRAKELFPALQEIWLENGRFISARSGVLVVKVLEIKERRELRQLICDGGRTTHALISNWEQHQVLPLPLRADRQVLTAVYGPTCMAFDQLARCPLPATIRPGDHLIWMDAGAYHIPWETRFSHGLAPVLWHEDSQLRLARKAESFEQWWGQWH